MNRNPRLPAKGAIFLGAALMLGVRAAFALDPAGWRHTQEVTIPQAGLARVNLPAATLDAARPDLSDLRLLDPAGNEVSFLVERPMPKPETVARPREFQTAIDPGAATMVTLRTGGPAPVHAVELETPARRFIKSVTVESSTDGLNWRQIAASRPIFRLPGGAENLRIEFPESTSSWLRFAIDDRRDEPIPFSTARLFTPGSTDAPTEVLPIRIESRDESPGVTRISIDLGAANLPVASLDLETGSPLFTRSVSLAEPEVKDGVLSERPVGEATIYRLTLNGAGDQRLNSPLERQIKTRELLLLIHNQDSAPLAIDGIRGRRREVRALFYAPAAGKYILLTGNSECVAPRYDLSGLGEQLKAAASTMLEPGPLMDNPGYRTPEALGSLSLQGAAFDPAKWKYRKALPVTARGAQQVEFDQDVLAHASSDLGDVRMVQAGRQIPFVLERTSITRTVPLSATLKEDTENPARSRWELTLPEAGLPLSAVTCVSPSPLFERAMRLREEVADERGDTESRELGAAQWSHTPGGPGGLLVLQLDTPPQSGLLSLETDNGDNAAIELTDFHGTYPVTRAVFKAPADSAQPVWLYYGNEDAAFPSYDLRLIAGDLLRSERQPITAGPREGGGGAAGAVSGALAGASRYLFWGALVLVVTALLAVTAKLLPKEDAAPPPPAMP